MVKSENLNGEPSAATRRAYLYQTADLEGYAAACAAAYSRTPDDFETAVQHAEALGHTGQVDEKFGVLRRLLALEPRHTMANVSLGLEYLMQGQYRDGWPHYSYRHGMKNVSTNDPGLPEDRRWRGGKLAGSSIVLLREQGIGDSLQFLRYAVSLSREGARPNLNVQPALRSFLEHSPAPGVVLTPKTPVHIHTWIRLVDLVPIFSPTKDSIVWPGAYITAPATGAPFLQSERSGKLRVGLAWQGNVKNPMNRIRSIPVRALRPLSDVKDATFYSVMPPDTAEAISDENWIVDLSGRTSPFSELARAVEAMDVIVTVCTSIAHLAGAMGKPTLLMLSALPDWRWTREGTTTPWYPSMHLFRQPRLGDWDPVVSQIFTNLNAL